MKIAKIGILLLSLTVLITAGFVSNQAFAGASSSGQEGRDCEAAGGIFDFNKDPRCTFPVGGIAVVVPDSVLYGGRLPEIGIVGSLRQEPDEEVAEVAVTGTR